MKGKRPTKYPHVEMAARYAKDVVAGKVLACKWVRLACKRHIADLKRARTKAYPFKFDAARAERACRFAELLPHVKGQWAARSERIVLQPHQCFRRSMKFGWVEKATGHRRFRKSYEEVPRKNAKSTDAAIDGLYLFADDGEYGAEVYSGATSEKQAWEVFRPARWMAERTPEFREHYGVEVNAKSLTVLENGSRFEPVIGKPGDGSSPSMAIVDEYHEHPDSTLYDTMETGMGARQQPMLYVITTAGEDIAGPCYALRDRVCKMLDGAKDDQLFGIIYTIDEKDDWTTEEALRKANPNYDVSVDGGFLREQQRAAIADPAKQNVFKTKHLNVWCSSRAPWMNMEKWHACGDTKLSEEEFIGMPCWMAVDLANRQDIIAQTKVFLRTLEGQRHYYLFGRYYCPEASVQDPAKRHYQKWFYLGHLVQTPGNDAHLAANEREPEPGLFDHIREDRERFDIQVCRYDPWNSLGLQGALDEMGILRLEHPQTVGNFTEAMKEIKAAVDEGRFHHNANGCMDWMMSNVTVKPDAKDNVFPRKDTPDKKIDGPVAAIMCVEAARAQPVASSELAVDFV